MRRSVQQSDVGSQRMVRCVGHHHAGDIVSVGAQHLDGTVWPVLVSLGAEEALKLHFDRQLLTVDPLNIQVGGVNGGAFASCVTSPRSIPLLG